jgi:hypothetical protein
MVELEAARSQYTSEVAKIKMFNERRRAEARNRHEQVLE